MIRPINDAPFHSISAQLPGIAILQDEENKALGFVCKKKKKHKTEAFNRGDLVFRNRYPTLDVNVKGNVDMVPLNDINKQQLIDDIMGEMRPMRIDLWTT